MADFPSYLTIVNFFTGNVFFFFVHEILEVQAFMSLLVYLDMTTVKRVLFVEANSFVEERL